MMKRILALGLCLLLAAGTARAETISDIGSYHSGWLSYLCAMADGAWLPATMSVFGTNEELGFHRVNADVPYIMVRIPEP